MSKPIFAQQAYISHATLKNAITIDSVVDDTTHVQFVRDSSKTIITAISPSGKKLWQTDPWKDNKLPAYRVKRPIIVNFFLQKNNISDNKDVLWVQYSNTQFGFVDKATGKFTFLGQD